MPCNEIRLVSVEFSAATNAVILTAALEALGYSVQLSDRALVFRRGEWGREQSFDLRTKKMTADQSVDVAEVKRQYAEETVNNQAQKFGWQVNWQTNAAGNREAAVQRRAY